jgi:hypothetical protein
MLAHYEPRYSDDFTCSGSSDKVIISLGALSLLFVGFMAPKALTLQSVQSALFEYGKRVDDLESIVNRRLAYLAQCVGKVNKEIEDLGLNTFTKVASASATHMADMFLEFSEKSSQQQQQADEHRDSELHKMSTHCRDIVADLQTSVQEHRVQNSRFAQEWELWAGKQKTELNYLLQQVQMATTMAHAALHDAQTRHIAASKLEAKRIYVPVEVMPSSSRSPAVSSGGLPSTAGFGLHRPWVGTPEDELRCRLTRVIKEGHHRTVERSIERAQGRAQARSQSVERDVRGAQIQAQASRGRPSSAPHHGRQLSTGFPTPEYTLSVKHGLGASWARGDPIGTGPGEVGDISCAD